MKFLISCVNSTVALIGYDMAIKAPFWYCPANIVRACGIAVHDNALWIATDGTVTRVTAGEVRDFTLPGPHDNLAHSIHPLGNGLMGVADTGNSRVLLLAGEKSTLSMSPLEGWGAGIPEDAIHLNDFIPSEEGLIASAFSYQPFADWRHSEFHWNSSGWGVLFEMQRHQGKTVSRIVATGLDCPHTLVRHEGDLYCCSSSKGEFCHLRPDASGIFTIANRTKVTDSHFLRGAIRLDDGWLLGGSSRRRQENGVGMCLYQLSDNGHVEFLPLAGPGEIYDILPWPDDIMPGIADRLNQLPILEELEGVFPERCSLPAEYR